DEAHVPHQSIALLPGILAEHSQFSLVRNQADNGVEEGGFARAVGSDHSEDAALLDAQIDAVQHGGVAERLAKPFGFDGCHRFSAPSQKAARPSSPRCSRAALSARGRAALSSPGFAASPLEGTSAARFAATARAPRR